MKPKININSNVMVGITDKYYGVICNVVSLYGMIFNCSMVKLKFYIALCYILVILSYQIMLHCYNTIHSMLYYLLSLLITWNNIAFRL